MKKEINWIENTNRHYLKDCLPLSTPLSIQIDPIRDCNFRCVYCNHFNKESETVQSAKLSLNLFKKFIKDCNGFEKRIKVLTFSGLGEPLLNNDLVEMIVMAKKVADQVAVVTNGSLLNKQKSDELISAGLDVLRVSLQGLESTDYEKTCGLKINFEKLYKNLEYFYQNKLNCQLFLKMPDIVVDTDVKVQKFYSLFEKISDGLIVEAVAPIRKEVNFDNIKMKFDKTMYLKAVSHDVAVCPQPFYMLTLTANGFVLPCCMIEKSCYILGDIREMNVVDMWNSLKMKQIRILNLENKREELSSCKNCKIPEYYDNKYNNIDADSKSILALFK